MWPFHTIHFISIFFVGLANAEEDWSLTLYTGAVSGDSITEVLQLKANFKHSNTYLAIAAAKKIKKQANLDWEIEGQFVHHIGELQKHMEFNGLILARWKTFPWDHILDTSFAIGEGLSLATEVPEIEKRNHDEASAFLNYLLFEITFPLQFLTNTEMVLRIHHRSGVFRLFDGVTGASNAVGIGIRRKFLGRWISNSTKNLLAAFSTYLDLSLSILLGMIFEGTRFCKKAQKKIPLGLCPNPPELRAATPLRCCADACLLRSATALRILLTGRQDRLSS